MNNTRNSLKMGYHKMGSKVNNRRSSFGIFLMSGDMFPRSGPSTHLPPTALSMLFDSRPHSPQRSVGVGSSSTVGGRRQRVQSLGKPDVE